MSRDNQSPRKTAPMSATIEVTSNGNFAFHGKLVDDEVDGIDVLLERLATHPLDRTFEAYGNFVYEDDDHASGLTCFFGNFLTYSHVFNIRTDDGALIEKLTAAIRANQQRPDYLDQPNEVERQQIQDRANEERRQRQIAERTFKLRAELAQLEAAS